MFLRLASLAVPCLIATFASAQSPHDWHYHELPHGPTAPGVHAVLGKHHQRVPFYIPHPEPTAPGPRIHRKAWTGFGWLGRYSPSPRPVPASVGVRSPGL
jgi:hypothetical protein